MLDPKTLTVLWPNMLWLMALLPLTVLAWMWLTRRRGNAAVAYPGLQVVGVAAGGWGRLRRILPGVLMLLGLAAFIFAVARPQASLLLPARVDSVMLAMDVSGSMRATDVKPDRLTAAQDAAKAFIAEQPKSVKVGIVSIAAAAAVVQSPTDRRESLVQAIDRFQLQRGTALGSGLVIALHTLLPGAGIDVDQVMQSRFAPGGGTPGKPMIQSDGTEWKPVAPGSNTALAIVLLTDGQSNVGPDPVKVAGIAAEHGVRIYTVGVGTTEGATLSAKGWSMRVRLDEEPLKKVANATRGEYFRAADAGELKKIYRQLGARLSLQKQQPTEVTAVFAALGALLAAVSAMLSMAWSNRIL